MLPPDFRSRRTDAHLVPRRRPKRKSELQARTRTESWATRIHEAARLDPVCRTRISKMYQVTDSMLKAGTYRSIEQKYLTLNMS